MQRSAAPPVPSAPAAETSVAEPAVVETSPAPSPRSDAPRRARSTSTLVGSTLTAAERSEYHYVERDLRNIGILSLAMVGLLILAYFIFTATGLIG